MSQPNLIIIGEVFLALVCGAGFLFYFLNNLNNQLHDNNESLKKKVEDEKRNVKGLRVKIQDQIKKITSLEQQLKSNVDGVESTAKEYKSLKKKYQSAQVHIKSQEKENKQLSNKISSLQKNKTSLQEKIQQLEAELSSKQESNKENFEELYHDLKNSVAYNMSGGSQILGTLKERLIENGNFDEGEKLSELKERYNSLGEMIGAGDNVVLFDQVPEKNDDEYLEKIQEAEGLVNEANETLKQAELLKEISKEGYDTSQEEVKKLLFELDEVSLVNNKLKDDLNKTSDQLSEFIKKARLFQAQKEQIKMHKATQNQMHNNYVNLSSDFKQLSRKFKTLEARNEILNSQVKNSSENPEVIDKLDELRAQLEEKEKIMDRLVVEKEMVEQQFLSISEDSNLEAESGQALERLQSEHQLLEQQFLEVLTELDIDKSTIEQ